MQEALWKGEFGDEYSERNSPQQLARLAGSNVAFFANIMRNIHVDSILEFGANWGPNIVAIKSLLPNAEFAAVEINEMAATKLKSLAPTVDVTVGSAADFEPARQYDLVFTKGVLIHIPPENLARVYKNMFNSSNKYILIAEYYNQTPTTIAYRGHENVLFKRDFAGDFMDEYPVKLVDYGFVYHRAVPASAQDGITRFLLEK